MEERREREKWMRMNWDWEWMKEKKNEKKRDDAKSEEKTILGVFLCNFSPKLV